MALDLAPLLSHAFLTASAGEANDALEQARETFGGPGSRVFSWELLVPPEPDIAWLAEALLPRLVYHCESSKAQLPACAGVFVSLFVGETLHCIPASEVVAFAASRLGLSMDELVTRWGTGERRKAMQILALPGHEEP